MRAALVLALLMVVHSTAYGAARGRAPSPPPITRLPSEPFKNDKDAGAKGNDTIRPAPRSFDIQPDKNKTSSDKASGQDSGSSTSSSSDNNTPPFRVRRCFGYPDHPCL